MARTPIVFLCHASEDKPTVQVLHDQLVKDGFDVWFDKEDLLPGQKWETEIGKAVQAADVVIICLTKKSIAKEGYVQREIKMALDAAKNKPDGTIYLIPARLEICEVPDNLCDLEWVDLFFDGSKFERYEYDRLLRSLRSKAQRVREVGTSDSQEFKIKRLIEEAFNDKRLTKSETPAPEPEPDQTKTKSGWRAPEVVAAWITAAAVLVAAMVPLANSFFGPNDQPSPTPPAITQPVPTDTSPALHTVTPENTAIVTPTPGMLPVDLNEFQDPKGIRMILIPAGKFTMGRSNVTPKDELNTSPAHEVLLAAYYFDKYEVTNGAYAACVDAGVCKPPYSFNSAARKGYYSDHNYTNFPVISVDWFMAKEYCTWRDARLPTEAEWERAARSNNSKNFPWGGNDITCLFAQYGACGRDTVEVGSHPDGASPYGVQDMAGNVWEWVVDWYEFDYYDISPRDNPLGPELGTYRVARGGSWSNESIQLWVTYRNRFYPQYSSSSLGFRCAKSQ